MTPPPRPLDGAQMVYIGTAADSTAMPGREALKGKVVVFRSHPQATSLGAPDLHPEGRLGLIAGIAFTDMDPIIESYSRYLRSPRLVLRDTSSVPPGVNSTAAALRTDRLDPAPLWKAARSAASRRYGWGHPRRRALCAFCPARLLVALFAFLSPWGAGDQCGAPVYCLHGACGSGFGLSTTGRFGRSAT